MPINEKVLGKYRNNNIFIETGTYQGDGINAAIASGFEKIYSIEIDKDKFEKASLLFKKIPNVCIIHGDSREKLKEILDNIAQPATIWLDAHIDDALYDKQSIVMDSRNPILNELQIISEHFIKTHTILIDDFRLFNRMHGFWGVAPESLREQIMKMNDNYKIFFEDGFAKNDILVATI